MSKAKIVATIGPSSQDPMVLRRMIRAGMDVARLNFSHGNREEYRQVINQLRALAHELDEPVAILQDLRGPKLRVGVLEGESLTLAHGSRVLLVDAKQPEKAGGWASVDPVIPIDVPELEDNLVPGKMVLMDDGKIGLRVLEVGPGRAVAEVVHGGELKSHKGINLPGVPLRLGSMTPKDHEDLQFGLSMGVDAVALSFVQTAEDVQVLHEAIREYAGGATRPVIIAKLERPQSIHNLEDILGVVDGVMVARGDLAVETSPEDVPVMQKVIINAANRHARLVITATQMLESMITAPRPTRAEASDVANAIFDGTDAIMLSGETAVGRYPVETVEMMEAIVQKAECNFDPWGHFGFEQEEPAHDDAISTIRAARELALDRDARQIVVFTVSGRSAMLMSKAHPRTPIVAFTPDERTYARLPLFWGVRPFLVPYSNSVEEMIANVEPVLLRHRLVKNGDQVVVVCGYPVGRQCPPNLALLHSIGSHDSGACP